MADDETVLERAAKREANPVWVDAVITIRGTTWNGKTVTRYPQAIASNLAAAGLLRSPRTEAEQAVIEAARAVAGHTKMNIQRTYYVDPSELLVDLRAAVAALDASEGGER